MTGISSFAQTFYANVYKGFAYTICRQTRAYIFQCMLFKCFELPKFEGNSFTIFDMT